VESVSGPSSTAKFTYTRTTNSLSAEQLHAEQSEDEDEEKEQKQQRDDGPHTAQQ